jgi:hypothetical protein
MDLLLQVASTEQILKIFFIHRFFKQVAQILLKSKLLSSEDDENDLQQTSLSLLDTKSKYQFFSAVFINEKALYFFSFHFSQNCD